MKRPHLHAGTLSRRARITWRGSGSPAAQPPGRPAIPIKRRLVAMTTIGMLATGATVLQSEGPAAAYNPCNEPNPPAKCFPPPVHKPQVSTPNASVTNTTNTGATLNVSVAKTDASSFTIVQHSYTTKNSVGATTSWTVPATGSTNYAFPLTLPYHQTVTWSIFGNAAGKLTSQPATVGTNTVSVPTVADKTAAAALATFQNDWVGNAFPNVSKAEVLSSVIDEINDPPSVNQQHTGLCGPAAIENELARRDPARFVSTVESIFDSGQFTTPDGTRYAASSTLTASGVFSDVRPADWIFMATLRDAGNLLMRISSSVSSNSLAWATTPAEEDNWLVHVVGLGHPTATAILRPFTTAQKVMPGAVRLLPRGVVILLIDSSLIGNGPGGISYPNHYIDLRSFSSSGSKVTFSYDTWGSEVESKTTTWSQFNKLTWDVLTAH